MAVQVALLTILYKLARFLKEGTIGKLRCEIEFVVRLRKWKRFSLVRCELTASLIGMYCEIEFVVRLRKWKRFSLVRCELTASLIGMLVPADRLTVESRDEFPIIPF